MGREYFNSSASTFEHALCSSLCVSSNGFEFEMYTCHALTVLLIFLNFMETRTFHFLHLRRNNKERFALHNSDWEITGVFCFLETN